MGAQNQNVADQLQGIRRIWRRPVGPLIHGTFPAGALKLRVILAKSSYPCGAFLFLNGYVEDFPVDPGESNKCCTLIRWLLPFFLLWVEIEVARGTVKRDVEAEKVGIAMKAFFALGTTHIENFHSLFSLEIDVIFKADSFKGLRRKHCPR